ncbi:ABC transporter permease [Dactylosporangium sp. NPDC005572]|uniref:ABC transporter permease n=1 Tax=Dactylosporangium sp. NPDC005572 TaxID=3156889 RepID=UPI0033B35954
MAYDDSRFRGEPGFREEPDFRSGGVPEDAPTLGVSNQSVYTPGAYPVSPDYSVPPTESTLGLGRRGTPSPAQLDDVFDDPEHGEPGRDRMAVHALWEMVLLLATASLLYLLRDARPDALRGAELESLFLGIAELGLVAVAVGLTLRAGAVNLAVGPIAYASSLFFADNSDRGLLMTASITALIALGVGVVIAVLVVGFHVPGWAASLGVALALMAWIADQSNETVVNGAYDPHDKALWWLIGVAVIAVGGAALGLIRPLRRSVGRFRPVHDPARRRGGGAASIAGLSIAGSALLAAAAGVLTALDVREIATTENGMAAAGLAMSGLALGAALLGGTSAYGRRGGVFGTMLAATAIVLLFHYSTAEDWNIAPLAVAGVAIAIGLVVTRLVETFGRPRTSAETVDEDAWVPPSSVTGPAPDEDWSPASRTSGWTSQLPARTTDDGWGVEERWGTR